MVLETSTHFQHVSGQSLAQLLARSPAQLSAQQTDPLRYQPEQQTDQPSDQPTPVGTHCLLELYDCPATILNDRDLVEQLLKAAAQIALSTLLTLTSQSFEPQGVTALALLAESHISIHTWLETGYAAVDVFTCGQHTRPEAACDYLIEQLQAQRNSLTTVLRRGHLPVASNQISRAVQSTA